MVIFGRERWLNVRKSEQHSTIIDKRYKKLMSLGLIYNELNLAVSQIKDYSKIESDVMHSMTNMLYRKRKVIRDMASLKKKRARSDISLTDYNIEYDELESEMKSIKAEITDLYNFDYNIHKKLNDPIKHFTHAVRAMTELVRLLR